MVNGSRLLAGLLALPLASAALADEAELLQNLRLMEYEISVHEGIDQAPNREHGFRTRFLESGIVVVPRTEVERPWSWGLSWTAFGRPGATTPVSSAPPRASGNRVDYRRGNLVEWYENSAKGLKQNFELGAPPEGAPGTVVVELSLTGDLSPAISEDGQSIDFVRGGERVLRYSGLIVTDARGDTVPARMEGFVRGIRIVVDDSDAVYPITIDPLATSPAWTVEGGQRTAYLGWSASTAGDVNGDGYSDVIVGAYGFDNGEIDEGRAYVFLGSPGGLGATAAWTVEANQAGAQLGKSVSTAGDVNGDGYGDVIVGAPLYDGAQTDGGAAWIYLGSAAGLSTIPAWTVTGDQAGAEFGHAVAVAGDVNGDGYSDVIVGAPFYDAGQTDEGRAYVFHGSATGPATTASWVTESNQAGASLGWAVATAGDVDSNGFPEVLVGAYRFDNGQTDEGAVFLYRGSFSGLEATASWTGEGNATGAQFGNAVSTAGDVNGDGYADVIVGANRYANGQTGEGRALVYLGSGAGLGSTHAWAIESNQTNAQLGQSVGTAGDVDGDGFADVLVGTPEHDSFDFLDEGRLQLFRGSSSGLSTTPAWQIDGGATGARYGRSAMTAGDVNGDGYGDVVVGAWLRWQGDFATEYQEGFAYVYSGGPEGLTAAGTEIRGGQLSLEFGSVLKSAGDVNGDGYADLLVGVERFDAGQTDTGRVFLYPGSPAGLSATPAWFVDGAQGGERLGGSVSGAGDVNGDGYDDILVGSAWYDDAEVNEGQVQLFLGSPSGPATNPAWTAWGNQASAFFGSQVASAGDVNGDGYADVAVGAELFDGDLVDEGRAFVYLGSASGLSSTPAWVGEGNQAASGYGVSVGSAGDVNGDGFSDLVVGARNHDNGQIDEGRVYLYLGSSAGLSTAASWTAEIDEGGARFGASVAAAGDVNNDGYDDILAGAPVFGGGDGNAFLYLGAAQGPSTTPAWSFPYFGNFGDPVTGAGDVNGDGFADIAISAPLVDVVLLFLGSSAGPSTTPDWTHLEGPGIRFGHAIASLGDVNGDAYADLAVGSPQFVGTLPNEGRVQVFYGNGGRGVAFAPGQNLSDGSRRVPRLGVSDSESAFQISVVGRTAFGRAKVRLQSEVEPHYRVFDGLLTDASPPVDTGTTGSVIPVQVSGRGAGRLHHWRVRFLHSAVSTPFAAPRGRWMTIPWGGANESTLRTATLPAGRASNLRVEKVGLGVTVTYQKSCLASDDLTAVYEGTLGDFTSHVPVTCESVGSSWNFTPQPGNRYFLAAPVNGAHEGSHGLRGVSERPVGALVCRPQNVGACP